MDYFYSEEHEEDDLPILSLPNEQRGARYPNSNNNADDDTPIEIEIDRQANLVDNWKKLYEQSIQSIQDHHRYQKSVSQRPVHPRGRLPARDFSYERHRSPAQNTELNPSLSKSKWEVQLPHLLNTLVGPDRQKTTINRRHTTQIILPNLALDRPLDDSYFSSTKQVTNNVHNSNSHYKSRDNFTKHSYLPSDANTNIPRSTSLTSLRKYGTTGAYSTTNLNPIDSVSTIAAQSMTSIDSLHRHNPNRGKPSPPISYPIYHYAPPTTTTVIKRMISSGVTCVYDSKTSSSSPSKTTSIFHYSPSLGERRENLEKTNSVLTGRQKYPQLSTVKQKQNGDSEAETPRLQPTTDNYYDAMAPAYRSDSSQTSYADAHSDNGGAEDDKVSPEKKTDDPIFDVD